MEKSRASTDDRLDALYREHPEGFVAGRDALVKELRDAGDRDEADRVKKLRRPSVSAWLLNRAALESPDELEQFAEASRRLEEAQGRAIEGKEGAAADLRAAATQEREATDAVVDSARRRARAAGHPPNERALELVAETLRAASGNAQLRDRVLQGRLEREESGATLGTPGAGESVPRRRRSPPASKRPDVSHARRELKRLQRELDDATAREERARARVEQAEETLRADKRTLAERKRERVDLERQLKSAEKRAKG